MAASAVSVESRLFNACASAEAVAIDRLPAPADAVEAVPVSELALELDVDEAPLSAALISFKADVRSVTPLPRALVDAPVDVLVVVALLLAEDDVSCSVVKKLSRSALNWSDGPDWGGGGGGGGPEAADEVSSAPCRFCPVVDVLLAEFAALACSDVSSACNVCKADPFETLEICMSLSLVEKRRPNSHPLRLTTDPRDKCK